ncbi:MAG: alpha-L-rhamnosidase, partial [Actinoplanes sp.]|nr:alpha-L-rhamnosidase [Actinoplanes sp.]
MNLRSLTGGSAATLATMLLVLTSASGTVSEAVSAPLTATAQNGAAAVAVTALEVDHQVRPLGVDQPRPVLGWQLAGSSHVRPSSGMPLARQTAYEVQVSTGRGGPGSVWDSGLVHSARSFEVPYGGPALASRTRYYWRVRVWDGSGTASAWSGVSWFETAFVRANEFHGSWIGAHQALPTLALGDADWIWYPEGNPADSAPAGGRFFRRTFDLPPDAQVSTAQLQMTADDNFTLYVNGTKVASSPDIANSWSTATIVDIASYLRPGTNVLAVQATNTFQGPAGLLGSLHIDGSTA